MMKRRILALTLTLALMLALFPVTAFADGDDKDLGDGYELLFARQGWRAYPVDTKDHVLTLDEMNVTLVDRDGNEVDPDAYDLSFEVQTGWDEQNECPVTEPFEGVLCIEGNEDPVDRPGFFGLCLRAIAKDGSGYTGATGAQNFMIWHRYSFNWYGANATFGEKFARQCTWSWHNYYEVPVSRIADPEVYGIALEEPIDPSYYTLTYYRRVTGIPVSMGDDYLQQVYPEWDPEDENKSLALDGLPTEVGSYFVRIDGKDPYYGVSYIDFDIVEPSLSRAEMRFRGEEEWSSDYLLDDKDQTMTLEDLDISVVDEYGFTVDPDCYELTIGVEVGYNDELHESIVEPVEEPYGLDGNPNGWRMYCVYATAKDGSGYRDSTRQYQFMMRDKNSLQRDGADINFGDAYRVARFWSWHTYYAIPVGHLEAPAVYDAAGNLLTDEQYELTWFERHDEGLSVEDDHATKYPDTDALGAMPTQPGCYYVKIVGVAPYYGTSYADFDLLLSYAFERGSDVRYYEGDTIELIEGEELYLGFDLDPYNGLLPGWRNDLLVQQGFEIDDDPTWFDDDSFAYAHIKAGDKHAGDSGVLTYSWYRFDDIFGEHAVGWVDAVPVFVTTVNLQVTEGEPKPILGDADGNGKISIMDATAIQRYLARFNVRSFDEQAADANGDGKVDVLDATLIQRSLAGFRVNAAIGEAIG